MDFFQRQDQARKNTKLLVFYFGLAVIGITVAIYLAALVIFNGLESKRHRPRGYNDYGQPQPFQQFVLWEPQVFFGVSVVTLGIIGCGSAFKLSQLASGGSRVAESLGGRPIHAKTTDADERKLLNIVEEMSIASGVPMPSVYVMDGEMGINAFAAGHTVNDAAVAVTRGCIQSLNRDELQGVIGHEFSHILNGDMRLNLRLMGIIFGILCLTVIGRILLRTRGRKNPLPLFGLVLIIVGWIGVFFGQLIQAAVSRQREFLADASAVQFTRNPLGLSGALQKIGGSVYGSKLESEHAQEASHMFFSSGLNSSLFNGFATHPPLEDRIRAIDPSWDGRFKSLPPAAEPSAARRKARAQTPPLPFPFPHLPGAADAGAASQLAAGMVAAGGALSNLGQPTPLHLRYAEQLRESFPDSIRSSARDSKGAVAIIYAMLLSPEAGMRRQQLQALAGRESGPVNERIAGLQNDVAAVAARARLPLVNLCLSALRELRSEEYLRFNQTLQWLIESDRQIDLFEFTLQKILRQHLEPRFGKVRRGVVQYFSVRPLLPDCAVLLSALARVGGGDEQKSHAALRQGAPFLRASDGGVALLPREECGLDNIDAALDRLAQAAPQIKKSILEASAQVAAADGVLNEHEAELLRAFADSLDCPIPPFVRAE